LSEEQSDELLGWLSVLRTKAREGGASLDFLVTYAPSCKQLGDPDFLIMQKVIGPPRLVARGKERKDERM